MALTVRRPTEAELDAVGRITVEAYRDDGLIDAGDDYLTELADAARRHREAEVWVAGDGEEVRGSVTFCRPGTPFAALARDNEGEFRMLAVARAARRRGVAEALVARIVDPARELGHDEVVICSMPESSTAQRLNERLGYRRLPERDWSPVPGIELLGFMLPLR